MNLKDIAKQLAAIGLPLLGGAVGGPAGAVVAKGISAALGLTEDATPEQTAAALGNLSGEQLVALRNLEAEQAKVQMQTAARQVEAVNKTIQTEAMGGSWLQRNHHAMECLATIGLVWAVYFVLPLLAVPVPAIPETAWITLGAILGVTAWQRGQANVQAVKT